MTAFAPQPAADKANKNAAARHKFRMICPQGRQFIAFQTEAGNVETEQSVEAIVGPGRIDRPTLAQTGYQSMATKIFPLCSFAPSFTPAHGGADGRHDLVQSDKDQKNAVALALETVRSFFDFLAQTHLFLRSFPRQMMVIRASREGTALYSTGALSISAPPGP
jgi:hypothetical protein